MKKLIAIMLMVLMVVPFGAISTSAAVDVPAEPVATSNTYVYGAYDHNKDINGTSKPAAITNDGQTLDTIYKISAFSAWVAAINGKDDANGTYAAAPALGALKDGGYFVIVGKALAGLGGNWNYQGVIEATTTPLVITAKDPVNGTSFVSTKDGEIYYMNAGGGNDGQYGMFMMDSGTESLSNTIVFEGDVIFQDTVILNRTNKQLAEAGKLAPTISTKGKLVIDETVQFASMLGEQKYTLDVQDGAYAYLHAAGFGKYTGTGTIVLDRALVENGTVTADTFAGFEGTIVDENGNDPFAPVQPPVDTEPTEPDTTEPTEPDTTEPADTTEPQDTAPATTEPAEDTEQPGNVPTGDASFLLAVIAAASVMAVVAVMIIKKKELN